MRRGGLGVYGEAVNPGEWREVTQRLERVAEESLKTAQSALAELKNLRGWVENGSDDSAARLELQASVVESELGLTPAVMGVLRTVEWSERAGRLEDALAAAGEALGELRAERAVAVSSEGFMRAKREAFHLGRLEAVLGELASAAGALAGEW